MNDFIICTRLVIIAPPNPLVDGKDTKTVQRR